MDMLPLFDDPESHQRGASDPGGSVWVAASAGTGKTTVLTDRVLRLLLGGCDPGRILCLTYTKAAAAEMANRVADRLGGWATMGEADLVLALTKLLGRKPRPTERRRARQLFTRVLDTPGRLGIRTIHAFCQSLLGRFPLEAGIPPHAAVLEDGDAAELMAQARHEVLAEAGRPNGSSSESLTTLTRHLHEGSFADLMRELATPPHRFEALITAHGSVRAAAAASRAVLGLRPEETPACLLDDACASTSFDEAALRLAAAALADGSAAERVRAVTLQAWLDADAITRAETFEAYSRVFLTKDHKAEPPSVLKTLVRKETAAMRLGVREAMQAEGERLLCLLPRRRAAETAEATEALLLLGDAILRRYAQLKAAAAVLDYGDLIAAAGRLLQGAGAAAWVLYKLDGGIDHVLIDEAQDTAPEQWAVVQALTEEFFAGEGGRPRSRTVFAVGDVKQSIFSFQGAEPAAFIDMREHFGQRVTGGGQDWRPIEMKTSFRSTRAVLAVVDATFRSQEMTRSIALEQTDVVHRAHRLRDGGAVELWPPLSPRPAERPPAWDPPIRRVGADSPQRRLAQLIARKIEAMLTGPEMLQSKGRPVEAGDVMVLVRRRTPFMLALIRALKERRLPVAGVDRMLLTEQIAVMDLMAVGRFVLLPQDDLTLAAILAGPLVGFDDKTLYAVAHGRSGSLWQALRERAQSCPRCTAAYAWLAELLSLADVIPPFEFFTRILSRPVGNGEASGSGRKALISRLGREAEDPIGEFLEAALASDAAHPPSLLGFLHRLERRAVEIKRDPEEGRPNEVRVMTVHGAKGLESPIVFLPDTCQLPTEKRRLLWPTAEDGRPLLLWPPRSRFREPVAVAEAARAAARQTDEYRRLLYVAMTRASDRLIVCGWLNGNQGAQREGGRDGSGAAPAGSWYAHISAGLRTMKDDPGFADADDPFLARHAGESTGLIDSPRVLRLTCRQEKAPQRSEGRAVWPADPLPAWALREPPPEAPAPRPLRPSAAGEEAPPMLPPLAVDGRFARGRLIHRLLQELPEVPDAARDDAARRWLARPVHGLGADAQSEIASEVLAVIRDPRFAPLFGPGSRAEVPIAGDLDGRPVAGQIDRLLVSPDQITVLDYKSDRPAPASAAATPVAYLRQMAAYRALLRRAYPGRPVHCVLIWTEIPRPLPLQDDLLDRWAP